jgi:hypothetical protein
MASFLPSFALAQCVSGEVFSMAAAASLHVNKRRGGRSARFPWPRNDRCDDLLGNTPVTSPALGRRLRHDRLRRDFCLSEFFSFLADNPTHVDG